MGGGGGEVGGAGGRRRGRTGAEGRKAESVSPVSRCGGGGAGKGRERRAGRREGAVAAGLRRRPTHTELARARRHGQPSRQCSLPYAGFRGFGVAWIERHRQRKPREVTRRLGARRGARCGRRRALVAEQERPDRERHDGDRQRGKRADHAASGASSGSRAARARGDARRRVTLDVERRVVADRCSSCWSWSRDRCPAPRQASRVQSGRPRGRRPAGRNGTARASAAPVGARAAGSP